MIPTIIESLYGLKDRLLQEVTTTVHRINSRNAANYWESERCVDYVHTFLKRKRDVEKEDRPELHDWIARFDSNKHDAAIAFWYEIHRGVMESLQGGVTWAKRSRKMVYAIWFGDRSPAGDLCGSRHAACRVPPFWQRK